MVRLNGSKDAKYQLGGIGFGSKSAVFAHCSSMTKKYGENAVVSDPADHSFLMNLIDGHPSADSKIGVGVRHFEVYKVPPYFSALAFRIRRTDGTEIDFSWKVCLDGTNARRSFIKAARNAANDQILEFKRSAFAAGPVICAISGRPLTTNDCHVDHVHPYTFDAIVSEFMTMVPWETMPLADADGASAKVFADSRDAERFALFHRERAKLRMLSPEENLSIGNRGVDQ